MPRSGLLLALVLALPVHAERADREKPIQAEADKLTLDNQQKLSVFEGNVVINQGTLHITADRVVMKEDKDGYRHATGFGRQATFRQKRDDVDEYVDGTSDRFEFDARTNLLELFGHANLKRGQDDIRGEYISYDTRTEFFRVNGSAVGSNGASPGTGRVHVTIQPTPPAETPPAQPLNLKREPATSGRP